MATRKRPKGLLGLGWACFESAAMGRTEHVPTSKDYPENMMRYILRQLRGVSADIDLNGNTGPCGPPPGAGFERHGQILLIQRGRS